MPQDGVAIAPSQVAQEQYEYWQEIAGYIKDNSYKLEYFIDRHDEINLKNISIERLFHMKFDDFAKMGCTLQAAHDIFEYVQNGIQSLNRQM